jgi:hypothetical protein
MSCVIISDAYKNPHAGWLPVDDYAVKLSRYLSAPLFFPDGEDGNRWMRRLPNLMAEPLRHEAPDGDTLLIIARNSVGLDVINRIKGVRSRFNKIYAWVADSYFRDGFGRAATNYDLIAVTDESDAEWLQERTGTRTITIRQGIDTLAIAPTTPHVRSIDLIGFGRLPVAYHDAFQQRFHDPSSPYLYLHSPLGTLTGPAVLRERGMLLKTLQRTRFSLAFHMFCNPEMNRPKSMMVTSRWLESLAAGCIVVGKRPTSIMADEMLFWPESTIELPDDAAEAVTALESLFKIDESQFAELRATNIRHMMQRHDIRHRISDLLSAFGIALPAALAEELLSLQSRLRHV